MRERENASQEPKGGILADEMGLGKTVMMLANIVNGKPASSGKRREKSEKKKKTTLIVASPALITQWNQEIRTHCLSDRENKHGIGRVIQHRAGSRIQSNDAVGLLESADIVLTTYHEG